MRWPRLRAGERKGLEAFLCGGPGQRVGERKGHGNSRAVAPVNAQVSVRCWGVLVIFWPKKILRAIQFS